MVLGVTISPQGCSSRVTYRRIAIYFFRFMGTDLSKVARAPTAPACKLGSLFFRLGGGLLRHNALSLIFRSRKGDSTHNFSTSSSRVIVRVSLIALLLSRRSCRFMPWSLVSLLHSLPVPLRMWFSCRPGRYGGSAVRWCRQSPVGIHHCSESELSVDCGILRPISGPQIGRQLFRQSPRIRSFRGSLRVEHQKLVSECLLRYV